MALGARNLNIKLSHNIIKEKCGLVSYKRGASFYKAEKVIFQKYTSESCEAIVKGTEEFFVSIKQDGNRGFLTSCSCPTLSSFQKDCQHIAAVLIAIYEHEKQGDITIEKRGESLDFSRNRDLTDGLLSLFQDQPARSSVRQLHFETRKELDVQFLCKVETNSKKQCMFAIGMKIEAKDVENIREFLLNVQKGQTFAISSMVTYDPNQYCFRENTDAIIQYLISMVQDEKVSVETFEKGSSDDLLLIPPSDWERLMPLLTSVSTVILVDDGRTYRDLSITKDPLPLDFHLTEAIGVGYILKITGMNRMTVLKDYQTVLFDRKLHLLEKAEFSRLTELKHMLEISGKNELPITQDQIDIFLEKVVPGLKNLGDVHISENISKRAVQTPLIAKLYLDRVSNRLLAGLEFQYGNIVFNPLEDQLRTVNLRNVEKESTILQIMDESSFAKTEGGYFMQNEELEYEFLYHGIPKLEGLVQIYATTAVRNRIFKGDTPPKIVVKIKKDRINWLEFKFEMDGIAEKQIRDVLQALEQKRKYYRLQNGSLLSLQTREFEEIKRFLKALPIQNEDFEKSLEVPLVSGFRLMGSVDNPDAFTIEESFRQFLDNLRNPDGLDINVPESVEPILRDYQKQGYMWMKTIAHYGFGGILADDMGLGKTLQSITFILSELSKIRDHEHPALVVCPSSLTYNWLSEFMKFAPEVEAIIVDGHHVERTSILNDLSKVDVLITSYPLLLKDIKWYEKQTFHTVFFDEAQAFKNPVTQTAKMVKKIKANHKFALTGTPIENSLVELWSIFHVVFPELFLGLKEYSHLTRAKIARRIRPFLLRRLKEDVIQELPDKIQSIESVELLPDQKKLYAAYLAKLRHDTLKHLDKETFRKNRIRILAGLTRLRQICCHPALFVDGYKGSSAKFDALLKIIGEAKQSGRRLLIFSQFTKMLNLIGRELAIQGMPYFYLDGQTPSEERLALCNRFNAGERDLFLISLKAGGTGLNLTGADTVILYDLWWNPAVEEQAADRAHRMGQTHEVQVIKLVARGTIEEKMNELQDKKRHLTDEIINVNEKVNLSLTEEDIRELLMVDGD